MENTKQATKHLVKAREHQESGCGRKCMYLEAAIILVLLVLVVLKYTS